MGRKRYIVRKIRCEELDVAEWVRKRIWKRGAARRLCAKRYARFCQINAMEAWTPTSIALFVASLRVQLSASAAQKAAAALKVIRINQRADPVLEQLKELRKEYGEEYAEIGVKSQSPDFVKFADAVALVERLPNPLRGSAAALLFLGPRTMDLGRLNRDQVLLSERKVGPIVKRFSTIDYKRTKNRRNVNCREKIHLGPRQLKSAPAALWDTLKRTNNWRRVSYDTLYDALHEAGREMSLQTRDGRPAGPGALRRAYIHARIAEFTVIDENGRRTDWKRVAEKTGHQKISTLKAHYDVDISMSMMQHS